MAISSTNLSNCDLEPIHIPGKIQSHGFLLAIDKDCTIQFISANTSQFIAAADTHLLGKPLIHFEQMLGMNGTPGYLTSILTDAANGPAACKEVNPLKIILGALHFNLIISPANDYTLLEFEPAAIPPGADVQKMINRSVAGILEGENLPAVLNHAAAQVKAIIQFDRVMIYRFAPDGHGEVVAEAKNDNLQPWLGLHYPASDIPQQARELYKRSITRLIVDVQSTDAAIATMDAEAVLDCTFSQLRAVSPMHIQYLKNMGVASSYSISLMRQKELWGLVACHSYTPRFLDYETREASKLVGQILSAALEFRQDSENQQARVLFQNNIATLAKYLNSKINFEEALMRQEVNLLHMVHATGAVIFYDNKQSHLGKTPGHAATTDLVNWIHEHHSTGIFYTSALSVEYAAAAPYQQVAAGMMVLPLSKELKEYIIWFKEEILQHVRWAGNPEKEITRSPDGMLNISPRHSFETWTKDVTGQSAPWMPEEIAAVLQLKEEILAAISTRASATRAMNERLQAAYEELDTFSYTISHDLKTPLTAIKGYAQVLAFEKAISPEGKQMLQRITDRAEKMNFMIKSVLDYSRITRLPGDMQLVDTAIIIKDIVQDLEHSFKPADVSITIGNMPPLRGDPVMLWQVFSNLVGNGVKYSQRAAEPAVHIEGWTNDNKVFYTIKDNGIGIAQHDLDNIFLLFSRMSNVQDIEGSGVGLAIVKKIVEKHGGIIWAESQLGVGTTFFLSFTAA